MSLFGKIGAGLKQFGKYYTSPEGLQTLSAVVSDYGLDDAPNYSALQARRQKLAQQQQQQQAIAGLMAQFQPDTMTPQVNELIGQANYDGRGRFNPLPMQQQQPGRFQFDTPQGQTALARALGSGVSLDGVSALRDFLSPKRELTTVKPGDRVYDQFGNVVMEGAPKPEDPLVVPQGGSVIFPGQQRFGLTNPKTFAPPRPSAGRTGSGAVGPVKNQPTRIVTY